MRSVHILRLSIYRVILWCGAAIVLAGLAGSACTRPHTPTTPAFSGSRQPLTYDALYGRQPVSFAGQYARDMEWTDDGQHYLQRSGGELERINTLTGVAVPAAERQSLADALDAHEDFGDRDVRRFTRRPSITTEDDSAVLLQHDGQLYFHRYGESDLRKLTSEDAERQAVTLSAHGDAVAFVRDGNLFTIDTNTGESRQLTNDGNQNVLNGLLDWVYQEEIYGRGRWRAHWWRDDARYLAFLRLDQSGVPNYSLVDYTPHISDVELTRYPKAGAPNATVQLGIANLDQGTTVWVNLSKYDDTDILIVRVSWTPDGHLLFSVQDREQRWLELNSADPATGQSTTLIREESPAWTNNIRHPHWLADGTFLWLSERDGWQHIYHCNQDGETLRRLTSGPWSVRSLLGYDSESGWVYFTGARDTVLEDHAYRVRLAGGEIERLTEPGFFHQVNFDPTFSYFFDTFSNVTTPPRVHLCHSDGSLLRVISDNPVDALSEYTWSPPEIVQIPNDNGDMLNARIIRPPNFDRARKYPVWCEIYGAPHSPMVRNRWNGRDLFPQYLAQQGYIVWACDPYSATGTGACADWQAYKRLGQTELADIEAGLRWLIDQGYADPERIGIGGYSYGGYMVSYALTHSTMFKLGIAGALVSDWRNYDTIYTERYMQTPEHNPEGYEQASVTNAAGDLHGRLLIVHGMLDDNVHFQNTIQLINALQQHDKMFDLMVYPRDRHGLGYGGQHYRDLRIRYILDNL
ncbi:MAG: S9 family peptidase [Planctomycetota bacterium]